MKSCLCINIILIQISFALSVTAGVTSELRSLKVEKGFKPLLEAVPLLLDAGGANFLKRPDGSIWIISIGVTVAKKPDTPRELLRRQAVALAKARANAVAELNGNKVTVTSLYTTKDKVTIENGVEQGSSEEILEEKIIIKAKGIIKKMPEVASWLSKSGELYYVAIGKRVH